MDFIIVTGMSGAGKSQAIDALEDLGYYCVDNVPPLLLSKFAEISRQSEGTLARIALVVDVRSRDMFAAYRDCLDGLRKADYRFKTLFLDCEDATLINRYKETRRRHPLTGNEGSPTGQAIREERTILEAARQTADFLIDTTHITTSQLKRRVQELFSGGIGVSMLISCMSFGYKHGIPVDADLVFDVRCLPNPFYIDELREQTGLDAPVRDYVLGFEQARDLAPKLFDLLDYLTPLYIQEGKSQLVLGFGCTGGKHRSVVFAELLAGHFRQKGYSVNRIHRDIKLPNKR